MAFFVQQRGLLHFAECFPSELEGEDYWGRRGQDASLMSGYPQVRVHSMAANNHIHIHLKRNQAGWIFIKLKCKEFGDGYNFFPIDFQ